MLLDGILHMVVKKRRDGLKDKCFWFNEYSYHICN